uniref:PLAT domain-containing protein n=1 Tax=Takifugu rubripes TaxID=31033 RepID=A0A3B5K932_TAKRU
FQRGSLDQFHLETDHNLGEIWKIRIWHDNTGLDPSWYIQHVVVWDLQSDHMFFFLLEDWLSVENHKNSTVEKDVLASCMLLHFRRVFTSQLVFGVFEHHLWVSLWEHPGSSCFTRGQRVMCSALVLHLYFALSDNDNTTLFNNTTSFYFIAYIILMIIYTTIHFLLLISSHIFHQSFQHHVKLIWKSDHTVIVYFIWR